MDQPSPPRIFTPRSAEAPPEQVVGVQLWLRRNLFYSPGSTVFTLLALTFTAMIVWSFVDWAFVKAVWVADSRKECQLTSPGGACWAAIIEWRKGIVYGRYPVEHLWRVNLTFGCLALWLWPMAVPRLAALRPYVLVTTVLLFPFFALPFLSGGARGLVGQAGFALSLMGLVALWSAALAALWPRSGAGRRAAWVLGEGRRIALPLGFVLAFAISWQLALPHVSTNLWGGLFLTLVIAGVGISAALPGGVLLELARRSQMPLIRYTAIVFIEVFRSVPLITVLFMAVTLMPLFLPVSWQLDKLMQAIIGICLFSSAYMAENVRAGLQALPRGQYEAAEALGLGYWQTMGFIILPQGLRLMIPNIVGAFIDMLRDTTLVSIIGLYDFLLMLRAIGHDHTWLGLYVEPLVFGGLVFFVLCYAMSRASARLERKLSRRWDKGGGA